MKKYILFFLLVLSVSSCKNYEEIEIKNITNVEFRGFENNKVQLHISMLIDNPSYLNIHLQDMDMKIYVNNRYVGKLSNANKPKIKRRSLDNYTLETELRIANIFTGISSVMDLKNNSHARIKMEGTMKVRSSLWLKTIDISEEHQID